MDITIWGRGRLGSDAHKGPEVPSENCPTANVPLLYRVGLRSPARLSDPLRPAKAFVLQGPWPTHHPFGTPLPPLGPDLCGNTGLGKGWTGGMNHEATEVDTLEGRGTGDQAGDSTGDKDGGDGDRGTGLAAWVPSHLSITSGLSFHCW